MDRVARASPELRSILEDLEAVRLDRGGGPLGVLPGLRQVLGADALVYLRLVEKAGGWGVEGFEADGLSNTTRARRTISEFLIGRVQPAPWVDLARPPPVQQNVAVAISELVEHCALAQSDAWRLVLRPLDLHDCEITRVLLFDEGTHGWIGAFSREPMSTEQCTRLTEVAAPLLVRMRIERLLAAAPRIHAALETTLQQIGAPALLVDARGRVHEMNRAARDLIARKRVEVHESLTALLERRVPCLPFTLIQTTGTGLTAQFLAVMRPRSSEERMALAVRLAIYRWKLTPRQGEVLELIVKGESNKAIGAQLGIGDRATELHVTAIFDRARVTGRAQLVAAVLLG